MDGISVVKLGGSVITDKSVYRRFRLRKTQDIAANLRKTGDRMAIVIGGGSFGHILSKRHGIPGAITPDRIEAASAVHSDMLDLAARVGRVLSGSHFKPYIFSTSSMIRNGTVDCTPIGEYIRKGFTPLLFGDTYISGGRIEIYSGDRIVLDISQNLKPDMVAFLTDVDGIYTEDPKKNHDARIVYEVGNDEGIKATGEDATGGMRLKLDMLVRIRKYSRHVCVLNGNHPERIALIGKPGFIGTVIS